jgi:hypothetical protein
MPNESVPDHGYLVQCLQGHVYNAPPELVETCRQHEADGYLDALILHSSECCECKYENTEAALAFADKCSLFGCPMMERCKNGCMALRMADEQLAAGITAAAVEEYVPASPTLENLAAKWGAKLTFA